MANRRRRHRDNDLSTRDLIVQTAEQLIAQHGVDGFRLKDIADEIGIQLPSIYFHFPGREAIRAEIGRRALRIAAQAGVSIQASADAGHSDPKEAIRLDTQNLVARLVEHPAYVRILLSELGRPMQGDKQIGWSPKSEDWHDGLDTLLSRGQEAGHFRTVDTVHFVATRIGAILANISMRGYGAADIDLSSDEFRRFQGEMADLALDYLRPS